MDEQPTEVLRVLLDPVVLGLDLVLLEKPQDVLLELPRALAGDDLDQRRLLGLGLLDDRPQGPVDVLAPVVDVVQVELQLHDNRDHSRSPAASSRGRTMKGWRLAREWCWP